MYCYLVAYIDDIDILNCLDLIDRCFNGNIDYFHFKKILIKNIDYKNVDKKIKELSKISSDWINDNILK